MKYTVKHLKQLLTDNDIEYSMKSTKTELLLQLFDVGILKREEVFPPREEKVKRGRGRPRKYPPKEPTDPRYKHPCSIQTHPMKVVYEDTETGKIITYDSIYKAQKATVYGSAYYLKRNRMDGRYKVTVLPKEPKEEKKVLPTDPRYKHLCSMRTHPTKVVYTDTETGETITYDSIYKAMIATGHGSGYYLKRNRMDGRYKVMVA